ncbi:MAG: aldo/keto reductase [Deltaproteobacteria bacterium]|nr:aldo/keto reductase [Deltaproteobacteria bacterium]
MEYVTLGRTGLRASVAGLGGGGPSRLGLKTGRSETEIISLARQAIDSGVNLIDTAEVYGTEEVIGKALRNVPRHRILISAKKLPPLDHRDPAAELKRGLEETLRRLKTDYVDIYHLHSVRPEKYAGVRAKLVPALLEMRQEGKLRFLGITENFREDFGHEMLQLALEDDWWDVTMVGFNILNQSARTRVLPKTRAKNLGVMVMFAVRRALSQPERLRRVWEELARKGLVDPDVREGEGPLDFLVKEAGASSIPDAAYRFCRHEPGVHVVLTGTGNPDHLRENLDSLLKPPLPDAATRRLKEIFANVDCISGD